MWKLDGEAMARLDCTFLTARFVGLIDEEGLVLMEYEDFKDYSTAVGR